MPEIIVKLGDSVVRNYYFAKDTMSIGRAADNEIVIENLAVSRNHAVLKYEDEKYSLIDLGSSNGTYVNGVKVKRTELMDKDVITLGKHKLYFYDQRAAEPVRRPMPLDTDRTMLVAPTMVGMLTIMKGWQKGQTFTIDHPVTKLGKGAGCDIQLNDWFVSREHALIERDNDQFYIRDLDSWLHTRLNGEVIQHAPLAHGDAIQLGRTLTLRFELESSFKEMSSPALAARMENSASGARPALDLEVADADRENAPPLEDEWMRQFQKVTPESEDEDSSPNAITNGGVERAHGPANGAHLEAPEAEAAEESSAGEFLAIGTPAVVEEPEDNIKADEELDGVFGFGGQQPEPVAELNAVENGEPAEEEPVAVMEDLAEFSLNAAAEVTDEHYRQVNTDEPPIEAEPLEAAGASAEMAPSEAIDDTPQVAENEAAGGPTDAAGAADGQPVDPALAGEISLWERALQNPSPIIRKQAARRLKQLTGKDYEY